MIFDLFDVIDMLDDFVCILKKIAGIAAAIAIIVASPFISIWLMSTCLVGVCWSLKFAACIGVGLVCGIISGFIFANTCK